MTRSSTLARPEEIAPPTRTDRGGAILVLAVVAAYAICPFLPRGPLQVLPLAGFTLAAAVHGKTEARDPGLLLTMSVGLGALGPLQGTWPLPAVLALIAYGLLAARTRALTLDWLVRGRLDRGLAGIIALFVASSSAALIAWFLAMDPDVSDIVARVPRVSLPLLALAGLGFSMVNAFAEELLFRGAMMHALEAALGRGRAALLIQAAVFGLLHIEGFPRGAIGVVLASIYGLMMGIVRQRSGGLLAPWAAHVFADITIFAILAALAT